MTQRITYYIVYHDHQWKISLNQVHYGPYANQNKAIQTAVDHAHQAGKSGFLAEVKVQGLNNQFRTEWTYGQDPYPPRG
jgi:Uncharacterized protein conserved in bacteria (DUF2188)